jgi:hypothetical protein
MGRNVLDIKDVGSTLELLVGSSQFQSLKDKRKVNNVIQFQNKIYLLYFTFGVYS